MYYYIYLSPGLLFLALSDKGEPREDKLEMTLDGGRIRLYIKIGDSNKSLFIGQSLNDDLWHTVTFKRRGRMLEGFVDEEDPVKSKLSNIYVHLKIYQYYLK